MIILAAAILGALYGGFLAKRRKGSRADIAQYAAGFAIAFALAGLFLSVLVSRMV
ncbi:MAG: apolipoprotein acyltransferase [Pseudomonadota bacterium]